MLFPKVKKNFLFKDLVPQILTSGVVYKFQFGLYNVSYYWKCVRYLAVRSGKHIGVPLLANRRIQPRKDSAVCHDSLNYYLATFGDFSVLCHENKKFLLELTESLLIMRD